MEKFIKELQELLKKHNVSMSACGCCGGINITKDKELFDKTVGYINGETFETCYGTEIEFPKEDDYEGFNI